MAIQKCQSREADNLRYTKLKKNKAKTQHKVCWTPLCTHTHTINVNKACALQQTTGKTGIKHSLCEIDVNITNGVTFFTHHEQYYIDIHVQILPLRYPWLTQYQCIL
jgi:hypothetical protein